MNAKTKSNSVVTHHLEITDDDIIITWRVKDAGDFTLHASQLSASVKQRAMIHGLIQRVSDRAAMDRNPETGKPATPSDKFARMKALADHYASGSPEWSPSRAEGAAPQAGVTYTAIANVRGKPVEEVRAGVARVAEAKGMSPTALLAELRKDPLVAAEIARLRAGDAPKVSLDDL